MTAAPDWVTSPWIGPAGIALGAVLAIYIAYRQRRPKQLDYFVRTDLALARRPEGPAILRKRDHVPLELAYQGRRLDSPRVLVVEIRNTGKVAVRDSDFVEPIEIQPHSEIIDAWTTYPHNSKNDVLVSELGLPPLERSFGFELAYDAKKVTLKPALMNPGERIVVQLLLDDPEAGDLHGSEVRVHSRFADQRRPMRGKRSRARFMAPLYLLFLGVTWGTYLARFLFEVFPGRLNQDWTWQDIAYTVVSIPILLLMTAFSFFSCANPDQDDIV